MISIKDFLTGRAELCRKKIMVVPTEKLLAELTAQVRDHIAHAKAMKALPLDQLNRQPAPGAWSALECLEHLSLYGDFYLPEIEKRIAASRHKPAPVFKSGLLGNYFAVSMLPKPKLNKMNTFKDKNPAGSALDKSAIDRFLGQQEKLLQLLEKAKAVSLGKTRTSISISNLIKLKLGDTFRFVIYHNVRHMAQAARALQG